jgi:hypothetical protein
MPEIRKCEMEPLFLIQINKCNKSHFHIATNQSLNQKVPMFLHRGFVF